MSFWSDLGSAVFGGDDSGSAWGNIAQAGATIVSSLLTSRANRDAADQAIAAQQAATRQIQQSNAAAQQRFDALAAQAQPGLDRLQDIAVGADGLTDFQRGELDRLRMETVRRLEAGGLGGSGRSVTAGVRDVETDFIRNALDQNRRRADTAAGQLANIGVGAQVDSANVGRDTGLRTASALRDIGEVNANETVANAALRGAALGDIASLFAADRKGRGSRYQEKSNEDEEELV